MQIHKIPWAPTSGRLNLLPPPFFFLLFRSFFIVDRHRFASTPEYSLYRSRCERKTIFTRVAYRGFIEFFYLVISITIARSDKKRFCYRSNFLFFVHASFRRRSNFRIFCDFDGRPRVSYDSPAQTERDLYRVLVIRGFVEILQRFHTLVPRATRRVAMVQHRFHQYLALWIVPATRIHRLNKFEAS